MLRNETLPMITNYKSRPQNLDNKRTAAKLTALQSITKKLVMMVVLFFQYYNELLKEWNITFIDAHFLRYSANYLCQKSMRVTELVRRGELQPRPSPHSPPSPVARHPPPSRTLAREPGTRGTKGQKRGNGKGRSRQMGKKRNIGKRQIEWKQEQRDD